MSGPPIIFLNTKFTNTSKKGIVNWHATHCFASLALFSSTFYGDSFLLFYNGENPLLKAAHMFVFHLSDLAEVRTGLNHFSAMLHNCHNAWRQGDGIETENYGTYKSSLSNDAVEIPGFFFECHCQKIGWMLRCATSNILIRVVTGL